MCVCVCVGGGGGGGGGGGHELEHNLNNSRNKYTMFANDICIT